MHLSGMVFLKAGLNRTSPKRKEAFLSHLNKKMREALNAVPLDFYKDPLQNLTPLEHYLDQIHVSWLTPYLRSLTENDIRFFVSALGDLKRQEVKKSLLFSNHLHNLKAKTKHFLQEQLFTKIKANQKELLPYECLPAHPLNILLELNSEELVDLINLAGLTDVAYDLKYIIDTTKLKQIQSALSQRQQDFIKSLSQQKENIAFKRLGLDKWEGDIPLLNRLIHQRGLNRFAKALYGQDPSLLWYILHKLDVSQAALFQQLCTDLKHPQGHASLIKQIADLSTLIQEKKV